MIADQSWGIVVLAALPWVALPLAILWRLRKRTSLAAYSPALPADAALELVSVIVPARDETRNMEPCLRSILSTTWPGIEVIVVNDHSADDTADIARRLAAGDSRLRVIDNPDLPEGWFGKQWACHNGAMAARGTFLLFTDADTRHGPELLARSMNASRVRRADLFSVVGAQTMETFWERLLQPHVFGMLVARFGDTERVNRSKDPYDKIANGQFMLMKREVYDRAGGHEAVRSHVAEDLRFAQEWTRLGYSVLIVEGIDYMTTRMYAAFGEIWRGWGKNIWAAGRDTISAGPAVKALLRIVAPLAPLWEIVPAIAIALALTGIAPAAAGLWGAIAFTINTLFWIVMHVAFRARVWYAVLNPLAACVLLGMFVTAAWKGDRVEWKGRAYISR
jgi:chlorobactene glucosyltransferase